VGTGRGIKAEFIGTSQKPIYFLDRQVALLVSPCLAHVIALTCSEQRRPRRKERHEEVAVERHLVFSADEEPHPGIVPVLESARAILKRFSSVLLSGVPP